VLEVVEAEGGDVAESANQLALVLGIPCLRAVLNERDIVPQRDFYEGVEVYRQPRVVHNENGAGSVRDEGLCGGRVHVISFGVDVCESGHQLLVQDASQRPHIGHGGRDHLFPGRELQGREGDVHSGGAGGAPVAKLHPVHLGHLGFHFVDLGSEHVKEDVAVEDL
jgi:hypothetical protein